ncbi:MAG: SDR family NAD(P)-dependent oxidoreductase [Pseudobdellovibrio sp.]
MNYTLITGASTGIGFELAQVFAKNNHHLILVARSTQKLEDLKKQIESTQNILVEVISLDLSKSNSSETLFNEVRKRNLHVDILVNNAGFGDHGLFTKSNLSRNEDMIKLNILTLTKLTHLFLPEMLKNKNGKILNVASTAAFQAGPLMSVYYATKAYVLSFSEGLSEELRGTGVTVSALCPGPTQSNFMVAANAADVPLLDSLKIPTSKEVAEYGYKSLMNDKVIAVHGFLNNILAKGSGFFPRSLNRKIVMKFQSKRNKDGE